MEWTVLTGAPSPIIVSGIGAGTNMLSFNKTDEDGAGVIKFTPYTNSGTKEGATLNSNLGYLDINGALFVTKYMRCGSTYINLLGCQGSGR